MGARALRGLQSRPARQGGATCTATPAPKSTGTTLQSSRDVKGLDLERQRTVAELENAVLRHQPLEGMGPYMLHAGRRE